MADNAQQEKITDPVVKAVIACRAEAHEARLDRIKQSQRNRDVFFGRQDFSHKQEGQSAEFLPKVSQSVEQMCAFVKRGLVQFGDWYSVSLDRTLDDKIDGSQVRTIINVFFDNLWVENNQTTSLPLIISDGVKVGLLESLMILKVHGGMMPRRTYKMVKGKMEPEDSSEWRLRIDLVRPEDYYPDPSGNGLYEIHGVERDFHTVLAAAEGEDAIYNKEAVMSLLGTDQEKPLDEKREAADQNQNEPLPSGLRKRVRIEEFWGTILDEDGKVMVRNGLPLQNIVCTVANGRVLIREPEPNPFWHQESPLIAIPLLRVPFSVWHRALYDDAVDLNLALNEMFNLMLDGGIAAVWGVRQIRLEDLEDPNQVADGIPQGKTLAVKNTLPPGQKVLETLTEGNVPQDAMAVFEFINREYLNSVLNNEVTVGALPPKQIRATEVVEASQSRAITIDGIVADLEHSMARLLKLSWYTILQNMDKVPDDALDDVVDRQVAFFLSKATPEERFALFFGKTKFKAFGLSATLAKAMHFQKLIALQQAVRSDPILMRAYLMEYSGPKMLRTLMRALNLNVDDVKKDQDELAQVQQEMQDVQMLSGMAGQPGGQSAAGAAGTGGEPLGGGGDTAAQVNQMSNTRTGLTPNA